MNEAPSTRPTKSPTTAALQRLATAIGALVVLTSLTYMVPGLSDYRPWMPGDKAPLVEVFRHWGHMELPQWAGGGGFYRGTERERERLREELGESVAANLGEQQAAIIETVTHDGEETPAVRIDPRSYEGIAVEIEDPTGRGMAPFYRQLLRTARREERTLTRISHLGDSSIATDLITHTVRRNLQASFGDGGHGFVLVARGYLPYGHRDVEHSASDGWGIFEMTPASDPDGRYGLGGVQVRGGGGGWAVFETAPEGGDSPVGQAVSMFELYYGRFRRGGRLRLKVDRGEAVEIDTAAEEQADAFHRIDLPDGPHRLEIRPSGGGHVRLYGVVLEREGPGVVYDSLGMVGARANRLLHHDGGHIAGQIEHRGTHLLVLGFGGNDADDAIRRAEYEAQYREVIRHVRGAQGDALGCLVFAPLDQGERRGGGIRTMRTVPVIVAAQRAAAEAEGCAFYDAFEAMGGEGAMGRWLRSTPRLGLGDLRHATPAGYEVIGNMFTRALLKGFAEWLERGEPG